jgi:guanylate kinase
LVSLFGGIKMKTLKDLTDAGAIERDTHGKYAIYDLKDFSYVVKNDKIIHKYESLKSIWTRKQMEKMK